MKACSNGCELVDCVINEVELKSMKNFILGNNFKIAYFPPLLSALLSLSRGISVGEK